MVLTVRLADFGEIRDLQRAVLRPSGPLPGDGPPPDDALHVAAFSGTVPVGAATLAPAAWPGPGRLPGPTWQLSRMAVDSSCQRQGVGRRVLELAVRTACAQAASTLWAMARVSALEFYTGAGWTQVGGTWIKPGAGPHRYITHPCD